MLRDIRLEFITTLVEDVINYVSGQFSIYLDDEEVGEGSIVVLSTKNHNIADIREQCDALSLHLYETMSSVRVFQHYFEVEDFELGHEEYDEDSFDDETFQQARDLGLADIALYEGKTYDSNTINVYGNLVLLSDISILKKHRRKGIGTSAIKQLIDYCRSSGFDYLLLKPFPTETDEIIKNQTELDEVKTHIEIERLLSFYEPLGFQRTVGKTDSIHLVYKLVQFE